jgi:uncharacterized protein YbjT (DUF2867 family)
MDMNRGAPAPRLQVLVVGATGSIGRLVVDEALKAGHVVHALVRNVRAVSDLPAEAVRIQGDLTDAASLDAALRGVDAIVFTHGSPGNSKTEVEAVDYGGVRNMLLALKGRPARIALMTAIGVTNRTSAYNRSTGVHDWKRRAERLVRASGLPYTIVRPGWFDYNARDQHRLVFLQGDRRHAGDPSDGVVARRQIAQVLVASLVSDAALRKTFELVAERGPAPTALQEMFGALEADAAASIDACRDLANLPLADEPPAVREDLERIAAQGAATR